ncbi:hypothetical protein Tco_0140023 [Tanacetum coccineum]
MTHDLPEGVVRFTNRDDEVAYKIPHKIEQYNSLSNLEKEHIKSVYLRNEEDKRRGVDYVMSKILGFYKECLELGPEYATGLEHEGEVTSREVRSFDKSEPQPQPSSNCPPLDTSLGTNRGLKPPIKPQSPDSFKMKVLDNLTIHTPPLSLVASFHLRDLYCYYRPCIDDPKKHYGFKPGLLGHSASLGVDFSKLGMIEDNWKLESKEVSFSRKRT